MEREAIFNRRRIARSLVTVLTITLVQTISGPIFLPEVSTPKAKAVEVPYASFTRGADVVVPAGVFSVTLDARGGAGGRGGDDASAGLGSSNVGVVAGTFSVSPGDRITMYPGGAGGAANPANCVTGIGGGLPGAASIETNTNTVTQSMRFNGIWVNAAFVSGGKGGNAGGGGCSGAGGGGGAASIVLINDNVAMIAAGGGGGAGGSGPGAAANANFTSNNRANGGDGANGGTCGNTDGGGGGGGGGGWQGGAGGVVDRPGGTGECRGNGGSRGENFVWNAITPTTNGYSPPTAGAAGTINYTFTYSSTTTCTTETQTVDIYTVIKVTRTAECTWTVPSTVSTIDLFLVGGGGGGAGDSGGGGGGGAGLSRTAIPVSPNSTMNLKVGYGGAGSNWQLIGSALAGDSTTVRTSTGIIYAALGGSTATNVPGSAGGTGGVASTGGFSGGAGGAGGTCFNVGASGKRGISNYFYGSQNTFGGGGGGGACPNGSATVAAPAFDGGGAGSYAQSSSVNQPGSSATANSGGGGGGGTATGTGIKLPGGKGGSGVILIRYATDALNAFPSSAAASLSGRWTPNELQLLDSSRQGWMDASGTRAAASVSGTPAIGEQAALDSGNSTGSTRSNLAVTGNTAAKATLISGGLSNYTMLHVARYTQTGTTKRRVITASSGNFISGHYNSGNDGVAHHNYGWITPTGVSTQNRWLLSTDMTKLYRANGRDVTYKADHANVVNASGPTNLGINNYADEPTDWQMLDVLVFNRQLSNGEIRAMESYLARIYGLSIDVASTSSDTDTAATMGSANYFFFNGLGAGNTLNDTFTIESWIKPTSTCESSICQIVVKESTVLFGIHSGYLHWALNGTGIGWVWTNTGIRIKPNEWHHVAMVKQFEGRKQGSLLFYLDGQLAFTQAGSPYGTGAIDNSTSSSNKVVDADDNWFLFGGRNDQWFRGEIDEIKIWKTARSASDIQRDMHSNDGSSTDLQMYYNFNMDSLSYADPDDSGITPLVVNLAQGGVARSDLYTYYAAPFATVAIRSVSTAYTNISFPRTIITKNNGWKVPADVKRVNTLVLGGGGGGGGGYQGGGGGAGGLVETVLTLTPGDVKPIVVGQGGRGTSNPYHAASGESSTAFGITALGGGGGSSEFDVNSVNTNRQPSTGGSGGGGGWTNGNSLLGADGTSGQGNRGGDGFPGTLTGGGGGGAGGSGVNATSTKGGDGGAGKLSSVTGTILAAGGGGSYRLSTTTANRGNGGSGIGGSSGYVDGRPAVDAVGGATNGAYGTGSGGGAGISGNGSLVSFAGAGGSGLVAVRWITASVPTYTKPTNAYLNVGMTETFTTNVPVDSATVELTRTFTWESSTAGAAGPFTRIKSGTGASNAAFAWVPSDTSTSGSNYLYRLTVTDSDTAGLFITDSSTAFALINPALNVSGASSIKKKINISKNETFTITLGTPTYRASLSPVIPGITIDTSTAGSVVLKIADTATVGSWSETLTVMDSVSAVVSIPLEIIISAPPTLLNTNEIVSNGMVLNLDAGNSQSLILGETTTATSAIWRDLSGNGKNAETSGTFDSSRTCTAPVYSNYQGGYLNFNGSTDCFRSPYIGYQMEKSFTVEAWFKLNGATLNLGSSIISQNYADNNINFVLGDMLGNRTITVAFYDGTWRQCATGYTPVNGVWNHLVGTYDGARMVLYVNGNQHCTVDFSGGLSANINTGGTWIGRRHDGGSAYYVNGSIATARIYRLPLSSAQVQQNYNATKERFTSSNLNILKPTQKYGALTLESFTATSGGDTKTVTFANGNQTGISWDTASTPGVVKLSVQESLTVGTYYDTVTVTDNLGQSSYLPLRFTVTKADTITVTLNSPNALNYTGSTASLTPTLSITGLKNSDTATASSVTITQTRSGATCAMGGTCAIGDRGPGGGIVFITPSTVSGNGKYFEAAPDAWYGANDLSTVGKFCIAGSNRDNTNEGATQFGIGWGETNTAIFRGNCTGGAVKLATDYRGGGFSNWFVPNKNELAEMAKIPSTVDLINVANYWGYWSSTEDGSGPASTMSSLTSSSWTMGAVSKSESARNMVRPVRMFTPCHSVDSCTAFASPTMPTNAGTYRLTPSALSLDSGSLSNYQGVSYASGVLTINKINQTPITIGQYDAFPGISTYPLNVYGGTGTGVMRRTLTSAGTANCALTNMIFITASTSGICTVSVTKAADFNYNLQSATATIYWIPFINRYTSSGPTTPTDLGLSGSTGYERRTYETFTVLSFANESGTAVTSVAKNTVMRIIGTGFDTNDATTEVIIGFLSIPRSSLTINTTNPLANFVEFTLPNSSDLDAGANDVAMKSRKGWAFAPSLLNVTG